MNKSRKKNGALIKIPETINDKSLPPTFRIVAEAEGFMDKLSYKRFKVGDKVSVKEPEKAYDKAPDITPDMVGVIKAFPPKVCKYKGPLHDKGDYFAYIEFNTTYTVGLHTYNVRGGVNICNLKKIV